MLARLPKWGPPLKSTKHHSSLPSIPPASMSIHATSSSATPRDCYRPSGYWIIKNWSPYSFVSNRNIDSTPRKDTGTSRTLQSTNNAAFFEDTDPGWCLSRQSSPISCLNHNGTITSHGDSSQLPKKGYMQGSRDSCHCYSNAVALTYYTAQCAYRDA